MSTLRTMLDLIKADIQDLLIEYAKDLPRQPPTEECTRALSWWHLYNTLPKRDKKHRQTYAVFACIAAAYERLDYAQKRKMSSNFLDDNRFLEYVAETEWRDEP